LNDIIFPNHSIESEFEQETQSKIHIRLQQRKARKFLTFIEGLDPHLDLKDIISKMKQSFCTNGTLLKSNVLQLNGDQRQPVYKFLIDNDICNAEQINIHGG